MRLIDCVVVNDEIDLFRFRVRYLSSLGVEVFCLAESELTWQGKKKSLHFSQRISDLKHEFPGVEFRIYQILLDGTLSNQGREDLSRQQFLEKLFADFPDEHLLFCDVDEFPSAEQLNAYKAKGSSQIFSIPMKLKYLRFNLQHRGVPIFYYSKIGPSKLMHQTINVRWLNFDHLEGELGEHFSFCNFDEKSFLSKITSYGTSEYNCSPFTDSNFFEISLKYLVDPLGRPQLKGHGLLSLVKESKYSTVMKFFNEYQGGREDLTVPNFISRLMVSDAISYCQRTNNQGEFQRTIEMLEQGSTSLRLRSGTKVFVSNLSFRILTGIRSRIYPIMKSLILKFMLLNKRTRGLLTELSRNRTFMADLESIMKLASHKIIEEKVTHDIELKTSLLERNLTKWGSDKCLLHSYGAIYSDLIDSLPILESPKILEIGIYQGASLRAFAETFPGSKIFGLDIESDRLINEGNIRSYYIDQLDPAAWESLTNSHLSNLMFDLIIDDGLHTFNASLISFTWLQNHLSENGAFVVEDVLEEDLSKWRIFGLSRPDLKIRIVDMKILRPSIPDNFLVIIQKLN